MHPVEDMPKEWENTLMHTLGITLCPSTEKNTFVALMPITPAVSQPQGLLHGGATLALAETIAGHGSKCLCGDSSVPFGLQVSANHLRAGRMGETARATATLLHGGRTTHVWNVDVTNEQGTLISTVRITNYIKQLPKASPVRNEQK